MSPQTPAFADSHAVSPARPALVAPRAAHLPAAKLWIAVTDAIGIAAVLLASIIAPAGSWEAGLLRVGLEFAWLEATWVACLIGLYLCGLYESGRVLRPSAAVVPGLAGVALSAVIAAAMLHDLVPRQLAPRMLATFAAGVLATILLGRRLAAYVTRVGVLGSRVAVVGTPEDAKKVLDLARRHPHCGIDVMGVVPDRNAVRPATESLAEFPVLGTLDSLEDVVAQHRIGGVVIVGSVADQRELLRKLRPLRYRGVTVTDFVALHEQVAREIPIDHIDDEWLFQAATTSCRWHARWGKRTVDFAGAALLLVVASPVLALASALIKLTSRGPVIFRQERVGLGSKPFMVLKLRTMFEDAEKRSGPVWSTDNDPRITPIGWYLRKFRIDELPQLVNVLRGEMSLIGPRPERPVFVEKLSAAIPFYDERHLVPPGITGWAQVMAPYASSVDDSRRKLQFDLYYAKHMSLGLDVLVAAKTLKTMLFGRERCQGGMKAGAQLVDLERQS